MKNIAFWSSTPQQGKTTAARFLVDNFGYTRLSFSRTIDLMLKPLLRSLCVSDYYLGEGKDEKIDRLGCSFRHLKRSLGTEWGRHMIREDLWVNALEFAIADLFEDGLPICVDDLRHFNELKMLKTWGFAIVKIERGVIRTDSHSSDTELRDFAGWDQVIDNSGSLENTCSQIQKLIK